MNNNILITIIIPVYKVEKYLNRCIESVLNQTYKNLEIILVDDGSPDICPELCDSWAEKDPRIKVIHKKNEGLSSARNAGLEQLKGQAVYFLDSDDFIACNTIEIMFKEMIVSNSDIVSASFFMFEEDIEENIEKKSIKGTFYVSDNKVFYYQIVSNHAWGKLYKAELFKYVRYPIFRNYEDIATTHILYHSARKISYSNVKLYFYRIRKGAITQSLDKNNMEDLKQAYFDVKKFYKNESLKTDFYKLTILYTLYSRLLRTSNDLREYRKMNVKMIRNEFNEIEKKVGLMRFRKYSPMFYKLLAYKLNIAGICIYILDKLKKKNI